jgi:signal transduction histidine kinase
LLVAPCTADEPFSSADRRLLDDLARQAGVAVHAVQLYARTVQLTADLQLTRERLITAREEERLRLRRDLHDGLGPQLASLTLKLETARNRLVVDPIADALLTDLTTQTRAGIADIWRLVYALRLPALDEFALVFALRASAVQ